MALALLGGRALGRALLALRGPAGARPGARRGLAALNHPDRFDVMGEAGAVKVTGCVPALRPRRPPRDRTWGRRRTHPPLMMLTPPRRPAGTGRRACW